MWKQELRSREEEYGAALDTVRKNGLALADMSAELKANENIVLAAVSQNGHALKYASADLRGDRGFVGEHGTSASEIVSPDSRSDGVPPLNRKRNLYLEEAPVKV